MSNKEWINIKITKWETYQPRKDLKASIWFRLQNSLFEDPNFFDFDHSEVCFWIYLLSFASKKQSGDIRLSYTHAERVGRFKRQTIESTLKKLQELQCIEVDACNKPEIEPERTRHAHVTQTSRERNVDVTLHNKQDKQDKQYFPSESVSSPPQASDDLLPVAAPKRKKFSDLTRTKMHSFIQTYARLYKEKYGGPPEGIRDKAVIGKVGHWVENVSEEHAKNLVEVYMQVDHRPINESMHDLWQFFRNLNRIGIALASGTAPGEINWSEVFK